MLKIRISFYLLIFFLVVSCKPSNQVVVNENQNFNLLNHIDSLLTNYNNKKAIQNEKFNIRIDYKGTLHTLKSNSTIVNDSIVFIGFSSTFSIPIASFYALPSKILVVDNPQKTVFETDYKTLSKKLGFTVSYTLIQNILTGNPYLILKGQTEKLSMVNNHSIVYSFSENDSIFNYNYTFGLKSKELKFFDISKNSSASNILATTYSFEREYSKRYPQKIVISFYLENNPIEIELDFRNLQVDPKISIPFDSTYKVIPLYSTHD